MKPRWSHARKAKRLVKRVEIKQFGKDHWSLLGYIETLCVDLGGVPDFRRLRIDESRHPQFAANFNRFGISGKEYPTRLNGGVELHNHDDWDCAEDLEKAGLVVIDGTGINPIFRLAELGKKVANLLREHKMAGGQFSNFSIGGDASG